MTGGNSQGFNIIKPNTTYHVRNFTNYTIVAQRNFWPQSPPTLCPPKASMLYGSVDASYELCSAPSLSSPGYWSGGGGQGDESGTPNRFSLSQNYPNPFNPTTSIAYEVPVPSRVQIAVYDVTGRLVAVLADEQKIPGRYDVEWNGHDRRGQPVASGVYFLRMQAGVFVNTKKLLLLK